MIPGVGMAVLVGPPVYSAESWLQIDPAFVRFADLTLDDRAFAKAQREFMRSPAVLRAVLAKSEIASLPIFDDVVDRVGFLRKRILVTPQRGTRMYTISMRSEHRESVAPIINAVREEYLSLVNRRSIAREQRLLTSLDEDQRRSAFEIKRLKERMAKLACENADQGAHVLEREILDQELQCQITLAKQIADRITVLETEYRGAGAYAVLSPAEMPAAAYPMRNMVVASIAGLGMPFVFCTLIRPTGEC